MQLALAHSNINNAVVLSTSGDLQSLQSQIDRLGIKSATDLNTSGTKRRLSEILAKHNASHPENQPIKLENIHWHDTKAELCQDSHQAQKNLHTADCEDCDHLNPAAKQEPANENFFSRIRDFFLAA